MEFFIQMMRHYLKYLGFKFHLNQLSVVTAEHRPTRIALEVSAPPFPGSVCTCTSSQCSWSVTCWRFTEKRRLVWNQHIELCRYYEMSSNNDFDWFKIGSSEVFYHSELLSGNFLINVPFETHAIDSARASPIKLCKLSFIRVDLKLG